MVYDHGQGSTKWRVFTTYANINVGAVLCFVEDLETTGEQPALPEVGTVSIGGFCSNAIEATVLTASRRELLIKLTDGSRWRLTPWTTLDPRILIGTRGPHQQNWVVRDTAQ